MLPPSTSRRQIPQIKQFHENFASFFSDLWKKVRSLLWKVFKKRKKWVFNWTNGIIWRESNIMKKKRHKKKMYNTSPSIVWKFLNRRNIPHLKKEKKYWNLFFFLELVVEVTKNLGFILKNVFKCLLLPPYYYCYNLL